jgi:hypothetical protein
MYPFPFWLLYILLSLPVYLEYIRLLFALALQPKAIVEAIIYIQDLPPQYLPHHPHLISSNRHPPHHPWIP